MADRLDRQRVSSYGELPPMESGPLEPLTRRCRLFMRMGYIQNELQLKGRTR